MSRGASARLFAAVDPPAAVSERLAAWAREVSAVLRGRRDAPSGAGGAGGARVRLLAPETMHVTLCFLGSRPVAELPALAAALDQCSARAGELSVGAPLWLPPRNPRSLALEIGDADGWLELLQRTLAAAFAGAIEWEPERRRFRAHLTVARIGRGKPAGRRRRERTVRGQRGGRAQAQELAPGSPAADPAQALLPPTPQLSFTPSAVVLYRSWLSPEGASYEEVASRALAGPSSDSSSASSSSGEDGAEP